MKLGFINFIAIVIFLGAAEIVITRMISKRTEKHLHSVQHMPTRYDFRDGKQILLHSGSNTYTEDYYYPAPPTDRRVTPEEHRRAWIQFWAEQEGHEPWD